jgi:hypothetical protein
VFAHFELLGGVADSGANGAAAERVWFEMVEGFTGHRKDFVSENTQKVLKNLLLLCLIITLLLLKKKKKKKKKVI